MVYRKKLIEVALPLKEINEAASYDKMPGIGPHPKGIHHWWARLPLPAARAILFASMVDDPSSDPQFANASTGEQEKERERLFGIIRDLLQKKVHQKPDVFANAKREMSRFLGDKPPVVIDPFSGGGSIPLEAQRLGLNVNASDLNPIAVLITKALIEIPPKFAGAMPINPGANRRLEWKGSQGLAEDIRYYGQWMRTEAEKRIGRLYPKITLPQQYGGGETTVIAWIWARTVASPNPACRSAHVPLVRSFALSTKKGKEVWLEPVVDRVNNTYWFEVRTGKEHSLDGTVNRRGAKCLLTGAPIPFDYIRAEGKAGRMGVRLMAIVARGQRGRIYLPPIVEQEETARSAQPTWLPDGDLPHNPRDFKTPNYGIRTFAELFTSRQLVALSTFSDLVKEAWEQILADARQAGMLDDGQGLDQGGTGITAYADAVATYLAFSVDRCVDFNNAFTRWTAGNEKVMNLFSLQAIPMVWDFAEANILTDSVGGFATCVDYIAECVETIYIGDGGDGLVNQEDATELALNNKPVFISTDPPYFDNIGYADLSDFFYVWLRRSISSVYPNIFKTVLVPKRSELVATPYRFDGNYSLAKGHFLDGFKRVFANVKGSVDPRFPLTVYYAFKQDNESDAEPEDEHVSSITGWETMLDAMVSSGFQITGTWPIRASQQWRQVSMGTNALASYIVLVCRPRPSEAPLTTRRDFLSALKREMPGALKELQHSNIAPVDLAQATIGPGMSVFSRYSKVIEPDGSPMRVRTALALINQVLDEFLSEQEGDYDPDTRWAVAWFEQFGTEEGKFGDAETLSKAKNVSVMGLVEAGIGWAQGGKVRLRKREELPEEWAIQEESPLPIWVITQYLTRAVLNEGDEGAAILLKRVGGLGHVARELAYRLYSICERKNWAQEALAYNTLVKEWPEIVSRADKIQEIPKARQGRLFEGSEER